jgi:hypothetical protein
MKDETRLERSSLLLSVDDPEETTTRSALSIDPDDSDDSDEDGTDGDDDGDDSDDGADGDGTDS